MQQIVVLKIEIQTLNFCLETSIKFFDEFCGGKDLFVIVVLMKLKKKVLIFVAIFEKKSWISLIKQQFLFYSTNLITVLLTSTSIMINF